MSVHAVHAGEESYEGGAGVSVLVCTRGAAFEMDWWKFGGVSVDTTILHIFPSVSACTDMIYPKELEHDVTTYAMARQYWPENFGINSFTEHDQFYFLRPKDE